MQCTLCQSDNVQKLSVIYQVGTQNVNTSSRTVGSGIGGGLRGAGVGFGTAHTTTSGTSQSLIAKMATPPAKKSYKFIALLVIIGGFFIAIGDYWAVGVILIGIGIFLSYIAYTYNQNEWPGKNSHWLSSWHCNKCGEIFSK